MHMSSDKGFCSFTLGLAHEKSHVWNGPKVSCDVTDVMLRISFFNFDHYISHNWSVQLERSSSVGRALVYRDPGSRVQIPAGGLGVAFFATGPRLGLKNVYLSDTRIYLTFKNLSADNECKCQILPSNVVLNWHQVMIIIRETIKTWWRRQGMFLISTNSLKIINSATLLD